MKYELNKKRFVRDIELMRSLKMDADARAAWHFFRELMWMSFGQGAMEVLDWWLWADSAGQEKILRKGTLCSWYLEGVDPNSEMIADISTPESLFDYISEKYK